MAPAGDPRQPPPWHADAVRGPSTPTDPGSGSHPAGAADEAGGRASHHDYIRHGTTTLFAALNVLDGTVIGQCTQRHRHQEFQRSLNRLERAIPAGKLAHVVLDKLWQPQAPESPRLARPPPALDLPLRADIRFLAQRRAQPEPQALCLDRQAGCHHRCGRPRVPNVRFDPLGWIMPRARSCA